MSTATDLTFDHLAAAWQDHHRLRTSGSSIAELSESRARLDAIRLGVRQAARSQHR